MENNSAVDQLLLNMQRLLIERYKLLEYYKTLPTPLHQSQKDFINDVKSDYNENQLVLVLGSGVSVSCGLPDWNNLVQQMLAKSFEKDTEMSKTISNLFINFFQLNNVIAGRYLLTHHNNLNLIKAIKDILYQRDINSSKLVTELANLCVNESEHPCLNSVITYNYDDILEENIRRTNNNFNFRPIFNMPVEFDDHSLHMYHVHGYLPRNSDGSCEEDIVFSERSYHGLIQNTDNWRNEIQINKFKTKKCIFIGTSLTDPNLRRLLDIANSQTKTGKYNYIIKTRYNFENIKRKIEDFQVAKLSDSNSSLVSQLNPGYFIRFLKDAIESYEEEDALTFNIKTIWVNNHSEIPSIIKKIKS